MVDFDGQGNLTQHFMSNVAEDTNVEDLDELRTRQRDEQAAQDLLNLSGQEGDSRNPLQYDYPTDEAQPTKMASHVHSKKPYVDIGQLYRRFVNKLGTGEDMAALLDDKTHGDLIQTCNEEPSKLWRGKLCSARSD